MEKMFVRTSDMPANVSVYPAFEGMVFKSETARVYVESLYDARAKQMAELEELATKAMGSLDPRNQELYGNLAAQYQERADQYTQMISDALKNTLVDEKQPVYDAPAAPNDKEVAEYLIQNAPTEEGKIIASDMAEMIESVDEAEKTTESVIFDTEKAFMDADKALSDEVKEITVTEPMKDALEQVKQEQPMIIDTLAAKNKMTAAEASAIHGHPFSFAKAQLNAAKQTWKEAKEVYYEDHQTVRQAIKAGVESAAVSLDNKVLSPMVGCIGNACVHAAATANSMYQDACVKLQDLGTEIQGLCGKIKDFAHKVKDWAKDEIHTAMVAMSIKEEIMDLHSLRREDKSLSKQLVAVQKEEQRATQTLRACSEADEQCHDHLQEINKQMNALVRPIPYQVQPYQRSPKLEAEFKRLQDMVPTKRVIAKIEKLKAKEERLIQKWDISQTKIAQKADQKAADAFEQQIAPLRDEYEEAKAEYEAVHAEFNQAWERVHEVTSRRQDLTSQLQDNRAKQESIEADIADHMERD